MTLTVVRPGLTVRDSQILDMLEAGSRPSRVVEVGRYRRSWTEVDVARVVFSHMPRPTPTPGTTPTAAPVKPGRPDLRRWEPPALDGEPFDVELTPAVVAVLDGLCWGMSNDQIAAEIGKAVETVKCQVRTILAKLRARDRAHAVSLVVSGHARVWVKPRGGLR